MGKVFAAISPDMTDFIRQQHVFFVATAPLSAQGHINVSPKGIDTFRVLSPTEVAYLDLTGSGNETSAHVEENQRITFLWCAFDGVPNILRLYGRARTVLPDSPEWASYAAHFTLYHGTRQIIVADIHRVQTSCGYAVPLMDFREDRDTLLKWTDRKGDDELAAYRQEKNSRSIDGLTTPLADQAKDSAT